MIARYMIPLTLLVRPRLDFKSDGKQLNELCKQSIRVICCAQHVYLRHRCFPESILSAIDTK
jgi:hypothetical protein